MRYLVELGDVSMEVDVLVDEQGGTRIEVDGKPWNGAVQEVPGGVLLEEGTTRRRVYVALDPKPGSDEVDLALGETRLRGRVQNAQRISLQQGKGNAGSDRELRAPMPGRVVNITVSEGAKVTTGDSLMVIEAMKMENELKATHAVKVAGIHVTVGQSVERGALLLSFEE